MAYLRNMLGERADFQRHRESTARVDPRDSSAEADTPPEAEEDNVSPPAEEQPLPRSESPEGEWPPYTITRTERLSTPPNQYFCRIEGSAPRLFFVTLWSYQRTNLCPLPCQLIIFKRHFLPFYSEL